MKKVLHVLPMNKLSGAEKVALLTCQNLINYEPVVICGGENLKKNFDNEGIKTYSLDFQKKNKIITIKDLRKIVITENIDIIHVHDNIASIYSYVARKGIKKDIKVISHIHSCYPWLKENGINKKIDSFFRKKYDQNIACGKLVYDFYMENSKVLKKEKVKVLSNAIDIEKIEKQKVDKAIYSEFKISENKKILGFIGRFEEMKGLIPFIKQVIKEKEKFEDCIVLLIGNGSQEKEIKKLIKENKLEEIVICTGFQEDVYRFYPIIDIFFLPSLYEGLPMVILEAMAFGKCVVSMNVGSIFEVIRNSETGILVNNDIEKFLFEIIKLKSDNEKMRKLGKEARKIILRDYSMKKYTENIEKLYLEL